MTHLDIRTQSSEPQRNAFPLYDPTSWVLFGNKEEWQRKEMKLLGSLIPNLFNCSQGSPEVPNPKEISESGELGSAGLKQWVSEGIFVSLNCLYGSTTLPLATFCLVTKG